MSQKRGNEKKSTPPPSSSGARLAAHRTSAILSRTGDPLSPAKARPHVRVRKPSVAPPISKRDVDMQKLRYVERARIIEGIFVTLRVAMKTLAWSAVAYMFASSVVQFAGKETKLAAVINALIDFRVGQYVPWALAALTSTGYLHERRLRLKTIQDKSGYVKQLEQRIDPNRSTSGLQENGEPTKEDVDAE